MAAQKARGVTSKAAPPSAAAPGGSVRSAGQHLAELNQRSAKLGSWNIAVFQPKVEKYSYKGKSTGEQKRGESFAIVCLFLWKILLATSKPGSL